MAATIATMSLVKPQTMAAASRIKPTIRSKPVSIPLPTITTPPTASIIAGAVFSSLSLSDAAFAAQQLADLAEGSDNRGVVLLLPIVPALAWVLYNILQPALNQLNQMTNKKGVVVGVGIGSAVAAAAGMMAAPPSASAGEVAMIADAAAGDNRGLLLLFVVAPAIAWVLYNILQPALNQLNRMRSE
ncbi:photosystem II reaction center proteins PsbY, chloroplastic-like [Curcuma longa]|uniref:photosystem II reaction center proteins PsbY, chloroplastic-like n=1 Tax=Curcuma longa TaxID=136217 RepID=UPI003D9F8D6E